MTPGYNCLVVKRLGWGKEGEGSKWSEVVCFFSSGSGAPSIYHMFKVTHLND